MADTVGIALWGDTAKKNQLQAQIDALTQKMATLSDPTELNNLNQQIAGLQQQMNNQLITNNVMDATGKFTNPNDIKNNYIDQNYLNSIKNQATQSRDLQLSNALKEAQRQSMKGYNTGLADVMGATEQATVNAGNQISSSVKGENENAYNKAVNDITNKFNMTKSLNDEDRQNLQSQISNKMQQAQLMGNLTSQEYNALTSQLAGMPDGLLIQVGKFLASTISGEEIGKILGGESANDPTKPTGTGGTAATAATTSGGQTVDTSPSAQTTATPQTPSGSTVSMGITKSPNAVVDTSTGVTPTSQVVQNQTVPINTGNGQQQSQVASGNAKANEAKLIALISKIASIAAA